MARNVRFHAVLEPSDAHREVLRTAAPGITFGTDVPSEVDVLVWGVPTVEGLTSVVQGGTLVIPYSGVATATRERLAARPDLRVFNLHHNADLVAEHAVALLLAASRRLVPHHRAMVSGDWRGRWSEDDSPPLRGAPAVILGYGAIGRRVGEALTALGMTVHGIRRHHGVEALERLLPHARALIVAVPLTPATTGLLDARRLDLLPAEAVLVNIARGAVCDEVALYEALRDRRIYGAGLDVWWRYPDAEHRHDTPPAECAFHELDNVVCSPHRAGHGAETEELRTAHLAEVLADLAQGRTPASRVDPTLGY